MGVNQLTGTPWHKERVHRADGAPRRSQARCKYFLYQDGHCLKRGGECMGCAHCPTYKAISDAEFAERQNARRKNLPYPDNDPYARTFRKTSSSARTMIGPVKKGPKRADQEQNAIPPVMLGSKVLHKQYGVGVVKAIYDGKIMVTFSEKEVSFVYPQAFKDGFLKLKP